MYRPDIHTELNPVTVGATKLLTNNIIKIVTVRKLNSE